MGQWEGLVIWYARGAWDGLKMGRHVDSAKERLKLGSVERAKTRNGTPAKRAATSRVPVHDRDRSGRWAANLVEDLASGLAPLPPNTCGHVLSKAWLGCFTT